MDSEVILNCSPPFLRQGFSLNSELTFWLHHGDRDSKVQGSSMSLALRLSTHTPARVALYVGSEGSYSSSYSCTASALLTGLLPQLQT